MADGEDFFAGEVGLGDATGLTITTAAGFPEAAVGDEEELLTVFIRESQAMAAGPNAAPGVEDGAVGFEDEHLIVPVVADHEKAAVFDLHHFVAVEDGVMTALTRRHPLLVHLVAMTGVADDDVLFRIRRGTQGFSETGGSGGGETGEEVAACFHAERKSSLKHAWAPAQ